MKLPKTGDRIRLIEMPWDCSPPPPGTEGTVTGVNRHVPPLRASRSEWEDGRPIRTQLPAPDVEATIDVNWDNGSSLALIVPADQFTLIEEVT